MLSGEQLFQVFDIVHKSKHPSHILEGILGVTSLYHHSINAILVVDITQIFSTKKISKGVGTQPDVSKCLGY